MPPPTMSLSTFVSRRLEHGQLGGDLRSRDDRDQRPLGLLKRGLQRHQFVHEQRACARDLREARHAMRARFGAMRGSEGVHHEDVAQRSHLARQIFLVLLLALVEAHVLQQNDFADAALDAVEPVLLEAHLVAEQFGKPLSDRGQRKLLVVHAFLRPPQMRHQHHTGPRFLRRLNRRQRRPDAGVARHHTALHGNVQILPDQHALAAQIDVGHAENGHGRLREATGYWRLGSGQKETVVDVGLWPVASSRLSQSAQRRQAAFAHAAVVSSMRLEKPHSLSYHAQTLTIVPSITFVMVAS